MAWINFLAFGVIAICIGGDAVGGKIEDGRYFVASHGKFTEVSREVWLYSKAHATSVWITHPVGVFLGGGLLVYASRSRTE